MTLLSCLALLTSELPDFMEFVWNVIIPLSIVTGAILIFIAYKAIKALILKSTTGVEGIIGMKGEVISIAPETFSIKVYVHSEIWNAESIDKLAKGDMVVVTKVEGLNLRVKSLKK